MYVSAMMFTGGVIRYSLCDPAELHWKELAMAVIKAYNERTDGAGIEDKDFSIVWHFEGVDPDYGQMQARELQKYLQEVCRFHSTVK